MIGDLKTGDGTLTPPLGCVPGGPYLCGTWPFFPAQSLPDDFQWGVPTLLGQRIQSWLHHLWGPLQNKNRDSLLKTSWNSSLFKVLKYKTCISICHRVFTPLFHVALSCARGHSWQVQALTGALGPAWQQPGRQVHGWHLILLWAGGWRL